MRCEEMWTKMGVLIRQTAESAGGPRRQHEVRRTNLWQRGAGMGIGILGALSTAAFSSVFTRSDRMVAARIGVVRDMRWYTATVFLWTWKNFATSSRDTLGLLAKRVMAARLATSLNVRWRFSTELTHAATPRKVSSVVGKANRVLPTGFADLKSQLPPYPTGACATRAH